MSVVILFPRILKTRLLFCLVLDVDIINAQSFLFRWCYPSSSMLVPKVIWISIDLIPVCHLSLLSFVVAPFSFFPLSTFHFPLWPFISLWPNLPTPWALSPQTKTKSITLNSRLSSGWWQLTFQFFSVASSCFLSLSPFEKDTQRFLLANMSFLPPRIWKKKTRAIHFESNAPIWPLEI